MALVVNGWSIYAHPQFLAQIEALIAAVEAARKKHPQDWRRKNAAKRLAAIAMLAFDQIPADPGRPEYRQGDTLGKGRRHWFRAKFFQQYRLFFRYSAASRILVLAWVNDEDTKRAYGSDDDAYLTFGRMLDRKRPPDDWEQLLSEARTVTERLDQAITGIKD